MTSAETEHGDPLSAAFGMRLASLRNDRGWSVQALADAADMSHRAVVYIEAGGSSPTLRTIVALAVALGHPVERLVAGLDLTRGADRG